MLATKTAFPPVSQSNIMRNVKLCVMSNLTSHYIKAASRISLAATHKDTILTCTQYKKPPKLSLGSSFLKLA